MIWVLALMGCDSESACEAMHNAAAACDLAPPDDTCDAPLLQQVSILRAVREDGCEALYDDGG